MKIDPTLQYLAARDYPYDTAGNKDGTMFLGVVSDGKIVPISFPGEGMEASLSNRMKRMSKRDADRITCAINVGHRWSRVALTHWVATARLRDVIRFVWTSRRAARRGEHA